MYAQIFAQDAERNSSGKTSWLNVGEMDVDVVEDSDAKYWLEITADYTYDPIALGTGGRKVNRKLTIQVSPTELARMLVVAAKGGLFAPVDEQATPSDLRNALRALDRLRDQLASALPSTRRSQRHSCL